MKLLSCVLSFNRGEYLDNCVRSCHRFFRTGDLLSIDDGSDDSDTLKTLNALESNGDRVLRVSRESTGNMLHGGLWDNMDRGVDYALEHDYDYIQFIQEDMQFVREARDVLPMITDTLDQPGVALVDLCFANIAHKGRIEESLELDASGNSYDIGIRDTGIWKVSTIVNARFRFGNGIESSNGRWWYRRGFHGRRLFWPILCHVPEPTVYREGEVEEKQRHRLKHEFFIKPMEDTQIDQLLSRQSNQPAFAEDFCIPWGWKASIPYYLRPKHEQYSWVLRQKYRFLIRLSVKLIPRRIRHFLVFLLNQDRIPEKTDS